MSSRPFAAVLRAELPSMIGGVAAFGVLHFGLWRWPQVRALFGNDEEWFLIGTVGLAIGLIWLYGRIAKARLDRAMNAIETEVADMPNTETDEERG